MPRELNDQEIIQFIEEEEEGAIDSASENEQDHDVIVSDHVSESELSENESIDQWSSEDEVPLQNLASSSQSHDQSFYLGKNRLTKWFKHPPRSRRERDSKVVSYEELLAFFGLLYMTGVLRSSHLNYQDLWAADGTGIEFS
ncbi:hypothetical protein HF086_002887 [Spodoptera exigua]|uniref:PiggyBac transposable element-derived protein domain-containing protein n=1 Tax=Spodoptera exigua TaxID=7107 RepID=A0A922SC03_SPOEX|nr:hypothetical protein HF086_002887 [Spodoptera exigua]